MDSLRPKLVLATTLAAACLAKSPPPAPGPAALSREDSTAIVRAAWRASTANLEHAGRVRWLWVPATADTSRVVPFSPAVRDALVRQGLPASERRPVGDDTVVFRVTRWQTDSSGVVVELWSRWTTVSGARRCRRSSSNFERLRARRQGGQSVAERAGPVRHGDGRCVPIP